jgi:hypothetical protein
MAIVPPRRRGVSCAPIAVTPDPAGKLGRSKRSDEPWLSEFPEELKSNPRVERGLGRRHLIHP